MGYAPRHNEIIMDPEYRAMVSRLREARESLGLSQSLLADKIGVAEETVGSWERLVRTPSLFNLLAWWRELDFEAVARLDSR